MDSNCTNTHTHAKKIINENKCPYPTNNVPHEPYNYVPQRHVPQIISELAAYKATELWLVCFTVAAVSIIICMFDVSLWTDIMLIVEDLFKGEKVRPPCKLHPLVKVLKEKIRVYTSKRCQLLIEVPLFWGETGPLTSSHYLSPYYPAEPVLYQNVNFKQLSEDLQVKKVKGTLIINESHEILWQIVWEAVFFMIAMKDHFQSDSTPNAMPLAYALKGTSVNNDQAWLMIKMVKKLYECQIPVLCYSFNGQWRNCVMQEGNLLTHLHGWHQLEDWNKETKT